MKMVSGRPILVRPVHHSQRQCLQHRACQTLLTNTKATPLPPQYHLHPQSHEHTRCSTKSLEYLWYNLQVPAPDRLAASCCHVSTGHPPLRLQQRLDHIFAAAADAQTHWVVLNAPVQALLLEEVNDRYTSLQDRTHLSQKLQTQQGICQQYKRSDPPSMRAGLQCCSRHL